MNCLYLISFFGVLFYETRIFLLIYLLCGIYVYLFCLLFICNLLYRICRLIFSVFWECCDC